MNTAPTDKDGLQDTITPPDIYRAPSMDGVVVNGAAYSPTTLIGALAIELHRLRSATATPFVDPGEEYDGWAEKEKAEELLREIVQMTDNAGIQRKIADYFKATKL